MLVAPVFKYAAMQFVRAGLGLRHDHGLARLSKLCIVGGRADLQFGKRIRFWSDHRLAKNGLAVVGPIQLEGNATPVGAIDLRTVNVLGLLACRSDARCLD